MWHVADEVSRVDFLEDNLGPLVPFFRALMLEEEIHQLECALSFSHSNERPNSSPLVRCVGVPFSGVTTLNEVCVVLRKGVSNARIKRTAKLPSGIDANGS